MMRSMSVCTLVLRLALGVGLLHGAVSSASTPQIGSRGSGSASNNIAPANQSPADVEANEATGGAVLITLERLTSHVPDPEAAAQTFQASLEKARQSGDKAATNYARRVLQRIDSIRRAEKLHLTLEEVIHRTLAANYTIQTVAYNPAIETTRVVEAEAAFDAVFFTNIQKNKVNRPTGSELFATDSDTFNLTTGVRKLLPSGMQVSGQYPYQIR